ncbi:MAG: GDP-mannose 4,6-dehydratase [bacterium]
MKKQVLITGATGFYGHHLVNYILKNTDWSIAAFGRESFAGSFERIRELESYQKDPSRLRYFWHNLRSPVSSLLSRQVLAKGPVDVIYHVAASSHVDRSIADPLSCVFDNVIGTAHILEFARDLPQLGKFFYFSTDEVFGSVEKKGYKFSEWDRYHAGNPYSATKAGGEELSLAYANTYGLPVTVTHCMNIVGERQHPEKYLPKIIKCLLTGGLLTVHTHDHGKLPGKRHYIYADTVSAALMFLTKKGKVGDKYNIEGEAELDNLALAQYVAKRMEKKLDYKLVPGSNARPGHDFEYGISGKKMRQMGWQTPGDFWQKLDQTIDWYVKNPHWL